MQKKSANPSKPEFYRRLEILCAQNGLSLSGLAEKIGLSNATASNWGRGSIPNGDTLIKIARELKTTTDYILTGVLTIETPTTNTQPIQHPNEHELGYLKGRIDELEKTVRRYETQAERHDAQIKDVLTTVSKILQNPKNTKKS